MVMAVAAAVACTGCSQNRTTDSGTAESAVTQVTESAEDQTETSGISGQALSSVQSGTMGVTTDTEDETDTYDSFDAEITLKDEDTKVKGNTKAVTVDGNQVTITAGGTYSITGSLTDGQLLVTGSEKACRLPIPAARHWFVSMKSAPFYPWQRIQKTGWRTAAAIPRKKSAERTCHPAHSMSRIN